VWPGLDRRILLVDNLDGLLKRLYLAVALSGIFFVALDREWLSFILFVFFVKQEEIGLITLAEKVSVTQVRA